jgi:antitoxin HicB
MRHAKLLAAIRANPKNVRVFKRKDERSLLNFQKSIRLHPALPDTSARPHDRQVRTREMKYLVEVFWSDEDEGYIAVVPDLPGCSAFGATPEEAVHEIKDAVAAWIEACQAADEPVPEPSTKARWAA